MLRSDIYSSLTITHAGSKYSKENLIQFGSAVKKHVRDGQYKHMGSQRCPSKRGKNPQCCGFSSRCFRVGVSSYYGRSIAEKPAIQQKHLWDPVSWGSWNLRPSALIPVNTCIKTDPSRFDYCDKEEAIEYVNAGDKVTPHTNQELPGFGNRSRGSCRLFKAHKA